VNRPSLCALPLYALVDPLFGEPPFVPLTVADDKSVSALLDSRQRAWQRPVTLAQKETPRVPSSALPYLVALDPDEDPWLAPLCAQALLEHGQGIQTGQTRLRTGCLIESCLSPDALMACLETLWQVALLTRPRYLRLACARSFELLACLAGEERLADGLGPIERWHALGRDGLWHCHLGRIERDEALDERLRHQRVARTESMLSQVSGWHLDQREQALLLEGELIAQTLDSLQREGLNYSPALMKAVLRCVECETAAERRQPLEPRAARCRARLHQFATDTELPAAATHWAASEHGCLPSHSSPQAT